MRIGRAFAATADCSWGRWRGVSRAAVDEVGR
jgi:hypothetical protein